MEQIQYIITDWFLQPATIFVALMSAMIVHKILARGVKK